MCEAVSRALDVGWEVAGREWIGKVGGGGGSVAPSRSEVGSTSL